MKLIDIMAGIQFEEEIEGIFNAKCLGYAGDILPLDPYGYRAWIWEGVYKGRKIYIVSWDNGNGYVEVIDWWFDMLDRWGTE